MEILVGIIEVEDKSFLGRIVSLFRFSKYSHIAFINLNTNNIYEQGLKYPVKIYAKEYKWKYKIIKKVNINQSKLIQNLNKYKDSKYDFKATILFYINRLLKTKFGKNDGKLNCVEFVGKILEIPELDYSLAPDEVRNILS